MWCPIKNEKDHGKQLEGADSMLHCMLSLPAPLIAHFKQEKNISCLSA